MLIPTKFPQSQYHSETRQTQTVCLRIVYAITQKSGYEIRNRFIFNVDQPGLEPGTSRL